jgi:hypothetical protein
VQFVAQLFGAAAGAGEWNGHGWGLFRQRRDHRSRGAHGDAELLCQGTKGAGRGIAESAQRGQQHMDPLIGFALPHAQQVPLYHLEGVGFVIGEQEEQPLFRCRQGAVLVDGKLAGGAGFAIEALRCYMRLKRRLEGRDELVKLVGGEACQIQELHGASLHVGQPYTGYVWCL